MSKGSKMFWVVLSILFAVGSITLGTLYEANRKKELNASIKATESTTVSSEKKEDTQKEKKDSSKSKKEDSSKSKKEEDSTEESISSEEVVSTADGQHAQQLIDVIIINGKVQSDFTLDEYYVAKSAVDALPNGAEKTALNKQITQIETALTNMGISF